MIALWLRLQACTTLLRCSIEQADNPPPLPSSAGAVICSQKLGRRSPELLRNWPLHGPVLISVKGPSPARPCYVLVREELTANWWRCVKQHEHTSFAGRPIYATPPRSQRLFDAFVTRMSLHLLAMYSICGKELQCD